MTRETKNKEYDMRFRLFLRRIIGVSKMKPRTKYLYPMMDGVPFKDLEVAILLTQIDYGIATNDNRELRR